MKYCSFFRRPLVRCLSLEIAEARVHLEARGAREDERFPGAVKALSIDRQVDHKRLDELRRD